MITLVVHNDGGALSPEQLDEIEEALRNLGWEQNITVLPGPAPEFAADFGPFTPLLPMDAPDPLANDPGSPLIRTSPKLMALLELYDELVEGILTPNSDFHFGRIREQLVKIDAAEKDLNIIWCNGKRQWNYRVC